MNIKAVIFDLDDTLFDQKLLREKAIEQSLNIMIENGLKCGFKEGLKKFEEIIEKEPFTDRFLEIVSFYNGNIESERNKKLVKIGKE